MICPRCGTRLKGTASECHSCGMPTVFMDADDGAALTRGSGPRAGAGDAVEPELLDSLHEAERTRFGAPPQVHHVGCSTGPGCGCLGLPLMGLLSVLLLLLTLPLWILSLGRVPIALGALGRQAWRRGRGRGPAA